MQECSISLSTLPKIMDLSSLLVLNYCKSKLVDDNYLTLHALSLRMCWNLTDSILLTSYLNLSQITRQTHLRIKSIMDGKKLWNDDVKFSKITQASAQLGIHVLHCAVIDWCNSDSNCELSAVADGSRRRLVIHSGCMVGSIATIRWVSVDFFRAIKLPYKYLTQVQMRKWFIYTT